MVLHISTSIEGLLTMRNRDLAGILQSVTDEDGNHPESVEEFRAALTEELQKGHKYIKSPLCDNFDPVYGCLGHERGVAYPLDTTIAQITGRVRNMEAEAVVLIPHCTKTDIKYEKRELVFCKDCTHWKPAHIKLNDGRQRLYREGEKDAGPLGMGVSNDIGINIGARCWVEHNTGYGRDMRVFRGENDFCSRAIKLPEGMTPEKWWGLSTEPKALRDD